VKPFLLDSDFLLSLRSALHRPLTVVAAHFTRDRPVLFGPESKRSSGIQFVARCLTIREATCDLEEDRKMKASLSALSVAEGAFRPVARQQAERLSVPPFDDSRVRARRRTLSAPIKTSPATSIS
jgi:hypothetical protein